MSSAAASAGTEGDLGAIDEVKSFHHEGDGEENLSSLNDLKQDLEQEADTDKAKQPSTPKVTTGAPVFSQNGTTAVPLPLFPKMAYSTAQPVQFMFPGIPGLVPNGTFPSTATITTSVPGAIKMEFPQNGTAVSGAPGMVLPGYHANLAMHAYPYMLAGQYMMPQLLPVAGSNGCSPNVIMSNHGIVQQPAKEKKPHIKKPLNAFMLFMKEKRQEVIKECTLKESAAINQILGKMWHQLDKSEQAKYYEMARQERARHMQMYPGWSARDNYALHKKRKRRKAPKEEEETTKTYPTSASPITTMATSVSSEELGEYSIERPVRDPNGKKCRARFGTEQRHMWCDPCKRKKRCIKFSDGEDECEGSSLSSSPTRIVGTDTASTSITMETNDDNNSVFNEAWEPLKTSSSHEVSSVVPDPSSDKKLSPLPMTTAVTSESSSGE